MSNLRKAARDVADRLRSAGYECYFAGGCVRDRLLGQEPHDFDIVTSARPDEIVRLFPGRAMTVGAHFGVVLVRNKGYSFDVATFREDGEYLNGRHPESVSFTDARHDAMRRDFTVNGLFEDPETGEIIDYVHGLADIEKCLIRAIGDPAKRFNEDALRLMRAVRFAVTKDFDIEPATAQAIAEQAALLQKISVERIRDEFDKILLSPNRRRGVEMLVETGLMNYIIPEILDMIGCEQPPQFHPEGDVFIHTMLMLDCLAADAALPLVLATLLHDVGKPPTFSIDGNGRIRFSAHAKVGATMTADILKRLRYPNQVVEEAAFMVNRHMDFINIKKMRPSTLRRFMAAPRFEDELQLHRADCLSSHRMLDNYDFVKQALADLDDKPVLPTPLVNGRDLISVGYAPGPQLGKILEWAMNEQLEGRFETKEQALSAIRRAFDPS